MCAWTPCIILSPGRWFDLFSWGGVEVTGGFFLLMAWLNYCDGQGLLPLAVCAAAFHELGHWWMIRMVGGKVTKLRLSAVGAEMRVEGIMSYGREVLCALAGPAVNLVLAIGGARIGAEVFAGLNLVFGLFNLLPLGGLDGGRALCCIAGAILGPERAHRSSVILNQALSALLVLCGGAVLGMGGNITLLVVAVWLIGTLSGAKDKTWRKKGLSRNV